MKSASSFTAPRRRRRIDITRRRRVYALIVMRGRPDIHIAIMRRHRRDLRRRYQPRRARCDVGLHDYLRRSIPLADIISSWYGPTPTRRNTHGRQAGHERGAS